MLFTPNDFNSSSVVAISGVCHSLPQVWHETVTPLKNGGTSVSPAASSGTHVKLERLMHNEANHCIGRDCIWC